jgi:membrane protein YqaA with SNARE-associated domain
MISVSKKLNNPSGFFDRLYHRFIRYADHPWAILVLGFFSFSCAAILPFPPDPLFCLIALRKRRQIPLLVIVAAASTTLGGLMMYGIGYTLFETVGMKILKAYGWEVTFQQVQIQLHQWGFWALILKAFTPIPYKIISLAYGVGHFHLQDFIMASFLGRAARYAIEGVFIWFLGPTLQDLIERYLKVFLWGFLFRVFLGFVLLKLFN